MRGASISGRPLLFMFLAVLTAGPAIAQEKHTSAPHQPAHQYLAGEAFELLRHDPASPSEMIAELAQYIGPKVVDWCYWRDDEDRFNVTYGGKENYSQPGPKETRCNEAGDQLAVPYADYTAAEWQDENDNGDGTVGTGGNDIIEGAHEEDQYDPLREVYVNRSRESACNFFNRHFWEPDDYDFGLFDTGLPQITGCPELPDNAQGSAVVKADHYWTRAKNEYLLGNKDLAYHYLGRVVHLLEDLSSTPHTHNDPHPDLFGLFNDDEFEAYMGRKNGNWDRNPATGEVDPDVRGYDNNYIRWGWNRNTRSSLKLTPVDPDNLSQKIHDEWYGIKFQHRGRDNGWPAWAFGKALANPSEARRQLDRQSRLFRLFYSLAETTDDFPSDGQDGDDRRYDGANDIFDVSEDHVIEYADTIMPAAIAHIAGLYRLFWNETHFPAPPSVMLLLLDRTGSMVERRPATGNSRCRDALTVARQDALSFFASGGSQAAVWSFSGSGIENLTGGFTGEAAVMALLNSLSPEGCDGSTPLADAICAASDELAAKFPEAPHGGRLLAISSDGEENSSSGECDGPHSVSGPPYDEGSWQQKTRDKVIRQSTVLTRFWNSLKRKGFDVETGNVKIKSVSDFDFFADLAKVSGGTATTADDGGAFPPPFAPIPQDPSCATGLALDDGSFENAFASSDTFSGSVQYAMRFNSGAPTTLKSVCVCFSQRNQAAALPFTLAVLDDNGAQGSPGTTLAEVEAFAASVPTFPGVGFYRVDLRGVTTDGSFFLGPRWTPNQSQTKFWVCADTTGGKKLPAFVRFNQDSWDPLARSVSYSALGIRAQPACVPDASTLCLNGGRFKVQAGWKNGNDTGLGHAVALTRDTGYFWFFDPNNVELVTKVLTACGANQRFWVFAGGLTDLETALTVTETVTGVVRTYRNPQSTAFRPIQDTGAFDTCAANAPVSLEPEISQPILPVFEPATAKAACVESPTSLCLNGGRFRVSATWRTGAGSSGVGQAVRLTGDTGYFWFFGPENLEVVVKTLNACALNRRFWVFGAGLTSVRTEITVEDTATGAVKKYTNPLNTPFQPIQDTEAFATCP